MARAAFDASALAAFAAQLGQSGERLRRQQKPFLRKEANKLRKQTVNGARRLGKKTGNYLKSIKRGKVYNYRGSQAIRVYSYAPHAHLIEEGHRMVTHDGREVGFERGVRPIGLWSISMTLSKCSSPCTSRYGAGSTMVAPLS